MFINKIYRLTVFSLLAVTLFSANGQSFKLPDLHNAEHEDLMASQENISEQIKLKETQEYLDILLREEEEEPEIDIYTEGWDSQSVNPYINAVVPDRQVIDVSKYCIPHEGRVTSRYGYRKRYRRMHKGIDIGLHKGDTVRAAFTGRVRLTRYERRGYGYYVVIRHTNGLETVYGHLSKFLVKPDQDVKVGDPIALGGNTGRSTGPHLHFETRFMGYAINPEAIFDFANKTTHTDEYTFDKNTYQKARNFSPSSERYLAQEESKSKTNKYKHTNSDKVTYKVRKGDTLSKIASRHGVTVSAIQKLNGMGRSTKLQIGKTLRIK